MYSGHEFLAGVITHVSSRPVWLLMWPPAFSVTYYDPATLVFTLLLPCMTCSDLIWPVCAHSFSFPECSFPGYLDGSLPHFIQVSDQISFSQRTFSDYWFPKAILSLLFVLIVGVSWGPYFVCWCSSTRLLWEQALDQFYSLWVSNTYWVPVFFFYFSFFCSTDDWTQDLTHGRLHPQQQSTNFYEVLKISDKMN